MNQQVAIVTGGGRGIGRGIVLALAEKGWSTVINYRSNATAAQTTAQLAAQSAAQHGGQTLTVQANIAKTDDREQLVVQTLERFGRIDLLVNNAGMAPRQRMDILATSEESYDEVMAVNLKGPFFLTQRVANVMCELQQAGSVEQPAIINIGSISAYTSSPSRSEYCVSKAGIAMMTALFADRLSEHGINVYELRPGIVETDMTHVVKGKYDTLISEGLTPIRRWGQPDDVGRAVVAIVEGYLPFSTGEVINIDGGFHMRRL